MYKYVPNSFPPFSSILEERLEFVGEVTQKLKIHYFVRLFSQIQLMSEKKIELEKRIHSIQSDRDGLSVALEEATDRIMVLERQTREQEIQVGSAIFCMFIS